MSEFFRMFYKTRKGDASRPDVRKFFFVVLVLVFLIDYALQMAGVIDESLGRLALSLGNAFTLGGLQIANKKLDPGNQ